MRCRPYVLLMVLFFATALSGNSAEVVSDNVDGVSADLLRAPRPLTAPWTILHSDGRVRIALEFPASLPAERLVHLHLRRARPLDESSGDQVGDALEVQQERHIISRPLSKSSQIVSFILEREQTFHRELVLWLGTDRSFQIRLPQLPHIREAARVVFVGGRVWPTDQDMKRVEEEIGGLPHVAILVGDGWASNSARGWEPRIPLLVPGRQGRDALLDILVGPPGDWRGA